jgi:hypothetical protein
LFQGLLTSERCGVRNLPILLDPSRVRNGHIFAGNQGEISQDQNVKSLVDAAQSLIAQPGEAIALRRECEMLASGVLYYSNRKSTRLGCKSLSNSLQPTLHIFARCIPAWLKSLTFFSALSTQPNTNTFHRLLFTHERADLPKCRTLKETSSIF